MKTAHVVEQRVLHS